MLWPSYVTPSPSQILFDLLAAAFRHPIPVRSSRRSSLISDTLPSLQNQSSIKMKTKASSDLQPPKDQKRPRLAVKEPRRKGKGHRAAAKATAPPPPSLGVLPAELWIETLPFLQFEDLINAGAISRAFVQEVLSKVDSLVIHSSDHLRSCFARRFGGVTNVQIACLFDCSQEVDELGNDDYQLNFNDDTFVRAAPFLSNFPLLERVDFFGEIFTPDPMETRDPNADSVSGTSICDSLLVCIEEHMHEDWGGLSDAECEKLRSLVRSFCGLYSSRTFRQTTAVLGLLNIPYCDSMRYLPFECPCCRQVCWDFPPKQVLENLPGLLIDSHEASVCLSAGSAIDIIGRRPDGRKILEAPDFFLTSLFLEQYGMIKAIMRNDNAPCVKRADIETELSRYYEFWECNPTIRSDIFELLTSKGIPIQRNDFSEIRGLRHDDSSSGLEENDSGSDGFGAEEQEDDGE